MLFIIWILIAMFSWIIFIQPQKEGFKIKKLGKSIAKTATTATKSVTNVANQVGGAIAKVVTSGMDNNTKMVLKNMKKIKVSYIRASSLEQNTSCQRVND